MSIDIENINIEKLRRDLKDYFTSGMFIASQTALINLTEVEKASDEKILKIALNNKINIKKYIK